MKIKTWLKYGFNIIVASLLSIGVLSLFCLVYSYSGIHIYNTTGSTDYKWQSLQYKSNMTEGFAWLHFDNNGFNNSNSNIDDIDILLIGSSHMEAVQINQNRNLGEILNNELDYHVYNIGMSGHQIYNLVNNYKNAIKEFKPNKYVIIETSTIELDEKAMQDVINGEFNIIPSYDKGIVYYAQKVPAFKNIYKQIQDWIALDKNTFVEKVTDNSISDSYIETLNIFLSIISNLSRDNNIVPIIFYHPSEQLNYDGSINYNVDYKKLNIFEEVCNELNISFIDMTPYFEKMYTEEHKLAHGFSNTHIGSGHLNANGHRVIANAIKDRILELDGDDNVTD